MERNCSLIFIVVLSANCLVLSLVSAAVTNFTADQDALLALKAHITHDPYSSLANNWSTSTSVCNWIGVTCGARHLRVTALNISYFGLTGTIPPQLGNLSFLSVLDLTKNNFHGSLPDEFTRLYRLKSTNFAFNNFNTEIPSWFGSFPRLQHLILRGNSFVGTIPVSLGNTSSLRELDLNYNQISGPIPSLIFNVSSLTIIDVSNNSLTGDLPDNMCQHLPVLQGLFMSRNQLTGPIPINLWQCEKLEKVSLSYNQFTGSIPKDIGNLTSLKHLYLGFNNLTGEIPNEIGNLQNLEGLGLQSSNLFGLFPAAIFNISTMKALALTVNTISGSLPSNIDIALPNLEKLVLGDNNFSGIIPSSITNISRLTVLHLAINSFSGFIPSSIGNLRSLELLSFSTNHLTATPDLSFLTSLTNCKNLIDADLSINPLNGILPSSIQNLSTSLEKFFLVDCNISGSIPEEISNLKKLTVLHLEHNRLTGPIPVSLGRLQQLQGLYLQYNRLEKTIPVELCRLDRLVHLNLNGNQLSGTIPGCLGSLASLRVLILGSNKITSVIPSSLWNLKDILHLNLSSNFLNGHLPLAIGNLKVVIEIDISKNNLSGDIPTTIGGLKSLQLLSLNYNRLHGSVPESVGGLTSLETLDMSNNNLSGFIPKSMETLSSLTYLNLSFNRLEGEIPNGGPFANFSAESYVGNYALCGSPRLKVLPCKTSSHKRSRTKVLQIVLPLSVAVILIVIAFVLVMRRCRKSSRKLPVDAIMSPQVTWRRISYRELQQATDGFSDRNLLGTGSYGSVYKGQLSDETNVAIKVFHQQREGALKSFDAECEVLSSIRHRNIVKIISSCSNDDFQALVLEYMPNGSLEQCLHSGNCSLDMLHRLHIMIDVASALEYLHFGYSVPVVHSDLKPNNVLLDGSMVAHLSDFGISKLLDNGGSMTQTQTLATIGYMAPEYGREGKVSRKCDVYSYGIMLLETFTRKKPTDEIFSAELSLRHWVNNALRNSVLEVVDKILLSTEDKYWITAREECLSSILNLAMDCTADVPEKRIDMKTAVSKLIRIREALLANTERG